jgi:signal recognition particle GTPase
MERPSSRAATWCSSTTAGRTIVDDTLMQELEDNQGCDEPENILLVVDA